MNERWHKHAILALVLVATMLTSLAQLGRVAVAQDATPASAPAATPIPGAQTWHILVNNVAPVGENWSFNTFYPDHLRVHPGDTIVFTLAPNPQAFHTVHQLVLSMSPLEFYSGFSGGFIQPNLAQPGQWLSTIFGGNESPTPCGQPGQDACFFTDAPDDVTFGLSSGVLVNPPSTGGEGKTSFAIMMDPNIRPGPRYVVSDADGPTMTARIDVVPPDQPTQSAGDVEAAAQRQYEADLAWLAGLDRVSNPAEASNPDGTETWQASAGVSGSNKPWLSINEFAPSEMVIIAGDTVTWTNDGPGAVPHTVTGFASTPDAIPQDLQAFQAGCLTSSGEVQLPPPGSFPPDIWNTCAPNSEVAILTDASQPSAPSGTAFTDGERTSGILLNQEYLDSPIGDGLPYASSYSVSFPNPGTYYYECTIHPGMIGTVVVVPKPFPR